MANEITNVFNEVYKDGPAGFPNQPDKHDIRSKVAVTLQQQIDKAKEEAQASSQGYKVAESWTQLAGTPGTAVAQPGRVAITDTGTHTDPVVGGTVPNSGEYRWSGSAWQRVGGVIDAEEVTAATNSIDKIDFTLETSIRIPPFSLNRRQLVAEALSFDLRPMRGYWLDTKLPWQADGAYDRTVSFPDTIVVDGKKIRVSLWSFDLRPLAGVELETGKVWPPIAPPEAGNAFPEMVVTTSAALVTTYFKSGNANDPTYIAWPMERVISAARNTDVWRSGRAYEATRTDAGSFTFVQHLWLDSEVETAIQIAGAYDHAGGKAHGNEEMTEAAIWLIDGVEINPSDGTTYLPGKVELVLKTRMFQPGMTSGAQFSPKGDAFVALVKFITLENGRYSIRHHVEELKASLGIQYGFFGMCPIARVDGAMQITHTAMREPLFAKEDVSAESHAIIEDKSERVKIWGNRYSADLRILDGWTDPSRLVFVDNRPNYNKIYPGFFRGGTHVTAAGAKYMTEISIVLSIKE